MRPDERAAKLSGFARLCMERMPNPDREHRRPVVGRPATLRSIGWRSRGRVLEEPSTALIPNRRPSADPAERLLDGHPPKRHGTALHGKALARYPTGPVQSRD